MILQEQIYTNQLPTPAGDWLAYGEAGNVHTSKHFIMQFDKVYQQGGDSLEAGVLHG